MVVALAELDLVLDSPEVRRRWVEDEPIAAGLQGLGEAVEAAVRLKPEVVVLDISMPQLNGLQAARQIRQVAPESEIVFLSQHRASDIIHEALAIGARGYVCKSHIASDLVDAVRAAGQIRPLPGSS